MDHPVIDPALSDDQLRRFGSKPDVFQSPVEWQLT